MNTEEQPILWGEEFPLTLGNGEMEDEVVPMASTQVGGEVLAILEPEPSAIELDLAKRGKNGKREGGKKHKPSPNQLRDKRRRQNPEGGKKKPTTQTGTRNQSKREKPEEKTPKGRNSWYNAKEKPITTRRRPR